MRRQSRTMSLVEAVTNVAVGYAIAVLAQMAVVADRFPKRVQFSHQTFGEPGLIDSHFLNLSFQTS